ncbi:MAG TPA: formimidoylglutamate deiminase [Chryseolinea sp.]|nr:formimidoylglutamate deiminase [Chryseolinea sp.]
MKFYKFSALLQDQGWMSPAYVGVDGEGLIQYLSEQAPSLDGIAVEVVNGYALPGFQNAHSHAFQFAMAGLAEKHSPGAVDDFWSWRETMYKCALTMTPEHHEAVAAMLYAEMLRRGYTHVAEFHYLHHDITGKPYTNLSEMGERLLAAAAQAGIKITLIPIFYQTGNFGKEPQPRQRRFISKNVDEYFQLLDDTANAVSKYSNAKIGFGVHSLRAVDSADIKRTFDQGPSNIPFHLHAAEQLKEVEDCLGFLNRRPVEWLLENMPLDDRFHLVHCTHMNASEISGLAASRANVVLCPGTEGNLGDGIFSLTDFAKNGGSWSIGTDSHISLTPLEDLRWLDYAQRLTTHRRNTFDDGAKVLFNKTLRAGRKAMNCSNQEQYFELNGVFDAVVFSGESPLFAKPLEFLLPSIIYTADSSAVLGTIVNGKWIVKNQRHPGEKDIKAKFRAAMKSLTL